MVVMLLDHARDFVHREGLTGDPLAPGSPPALFFTRWITHFCAPTFVLLAGLSARLQLERGTPRAELAGWLGRRGLFLVLLELVVLRPLIWFQFDYAFLAHLQVIWAIGWAMAGLALLLRLRANDAVIGTLGLLLVAGHNLLPYVHVDWTEAPWSWHALYVVLLRRGGIQFGEGGPVAFVHYPLLPWFGVMACGFWLGRWFLRPDAERRRRLLATGTAAVLGFLLLRGLGAYGDPRPWSPQAAVGESLLAFLRVEKYPPSLLFVLMTAGPAVLALGLWDRVRGDGPARLLITIGRVPLFFYVLQWPAVHLASRLFQWLAGQPLGWDAPNPVTLGTELPPGCGFGLGAVWLAWALCLLVLAPLAVGFAKWKRANAHRAFVHYV